MTYIIVLMLGSGGWIRTSDLDVNSILRYRCATPEYLLYYTVVFSGSQEVSSGFCYFKAAANFARMAT